MDYDVKKSLKRIEDELIDSMMRNLSRHLNEEEALGFDWSQWQAEQLQALDALRRSNPKKYGRRFARINARMRKAIQEAEAKGQKEEELRILKALTEHGALAERLSAGGNGVGGEQFFRTNESKLDALLSATQRDMEKAEQAVLRRANDQYRKIIFDAQVYANTGAGTVEKAVDMATKDFLAKGIDSIVYANGARHTISDYADMYIRTAERRAYLMGQGQKRQEWGLSLVLVNRRGTMQGGNHGHACPHCIPWLGKVLVDDVYSGGEPDGVHPLLSEAMAAGFLHPRCKDGFTTYFPGISSAPDPATKGEIREAVEEEKRENRERYVQRQAGKYERLAKYSLDPENRRRYAARAEEWRKKCAEGQGDVLNAPDIAPKGAQPPKPSGTTPFDIDKARKEYGQWVETLDEPYRSALRYYNENTDYIEINDPQAAPFSYSGKEDAILFNIGHPAFNDYDFRSANTHELSHRFDLLSGTPSWTDGSFLAGLTGAQEYVKTNIKGITDSLKNLKPDERNEFFEDLLSAVGVPPRYLITGRSSSYWNDITRAAEVFANLVTLETEKSVSMYRVRQWFPDLYKSFAKRMEGVKNGDSVT